MAPSMLHKHAPRRCRAAAWRLPSTVRARLCAWPPRQPVLPETWHAALHFLHSLLRWCASVI